jgi:hypothetical protein
MTVMTNLQCDFVVDGQVVRVFWQQVLIILFQVLVIITA